MHHDVEAMPRQNFDFRPVFPFQLYQPYFPVRGFVLWNGTEASAAAEATVSDNLAAQWGHWRSHRLPVCQSILPLRR